MFPVEFAFRVVDEYSEPGDRILDPFAGRASSIYAAAATGRCGHGIEINEIGWLYGRVKLRPAAEEFVLRRLAQIGTQAAGLDRERIDALPPFFRACYASNVLRFLVVARERLRWRTSDTDATLMAIILVYLHGKRTGSLSNQMRQGKAMAPDYCLRWWREHDFDPPDVDPVQFLEQRIRWRYAKGRPVLGPASVVRGDSTRMLARMAGAVRRGEQDRFRLLFTSPPYFGITNYFYDQWLRLWMLGRPERPVRTGGPWQNKFESRPAYERLLTKVFRDCARLMAKPASVYVRTDARPFTHLMTRVALRSAFPGASAEAVPRPLEGKSQTQLFGDTAPKPGEVDLILRI